MQLMGLSAVTYIVFIVFICRAFHLCCRPTPKPTPKQTLPQTQPRRVAA